ncbi:hypothetical protein Adt_02867 [Abeliophyllum distichum]|uniref:Uncharacterized protein n=1 Tax=Abeliophyllum distichum TaxID=126358 RepID=A0ABD1VWV2_9LAMI
MLLLPRSIASLKDLFHWDSATSHHVPPPKEHRFAQWPLPLRLGHFSACSSSQEAYIRLRASSTRTRTLSSILLFPSSIALLKGLSHWNSATSQHAPPPKEHHFTQGPLPLRLGHVAACFSSQGASLRLRASSTGTQPLSSILSFQGASLHSWASPTGTQPLYIMVLLPRSIASRKGLPHWDLATSQHAPPSKEHRFARGPLPLGLGHFAACSSS